jgi:hypothetical protein
VLQSVSFQNHGQKRGTGFAAETNASGIGQIPVGIGQNLLSGAIQALQQTLGTSAAGGSAGAAVGGVTGAAAGGATGGTGNGAATAGGSAALTAPGNAGVGQAVSGFLHTLFQTLQQDGAGSSNSAGTPPANAASAAATAGSASQYAGSFESSLQSLIHQLGSTGASTPATANLNASFANLVSSVDAAGGGTGAGTATTAGSAAGTSSVPPTNSTAQLQSFLGNYLHQLQNPGQHAPSLLGSNVNANV